MTAQHALALDHDAARDAPAPPEPGATTTVASFFVPGKPVAKARARHARVGNFVRTYTPKETVEYENLVRMAAHEAMGGQPPCDRPIALRLRIGLPCPSSWSARRQHEAYAGLILPTKKPDADNIEKSIKDGCNRIVWGDDSQVVDAVKSKRYAETPGVHVEVVALDARRAP